MILRQFLNDIVKVESEQNVINIFSVASGHLYERFLSIMMVSVMKNTQSTVKFWLIDDFLSPKFKVKQIFISSCLYQSWLRNINLILNL